MGVYKKFKKAIRKVWFEENAAPSAPQEPILALYILMRNDLASLNSGKAVAQGSHSANQMVHDAHLSAASSPSTRCEEIKDMVTQWSSEASGFGTCIVLSVNEHQMRSTVALAKSLGIHAGITHDPTYPLKDGESFHLIPLDTCAYVFGYKHELKSIVGEFNLMP